MFFANPILLWALSLGLIPIAIYYLLRFRSLKVSWGANYVLERALERLKNKFNLDQIILMTLRVLACLLIVLAFARPMLRSHGATASSTGTHHIIVLDASYSMLAGPQGHRRFDAAMDAIRKLTATWGRGETWSLLLLADQPRWIIDTQPVVSPQDTQTKLEALHPAESSASLAAAFTQLAQKFPRGPAEVFVFSDDQASTWEHADQIKLPPELDAAIYWFNPAGEPRPNLAVTALRPAADRVLTENPCRVTASIRNFSAVKMEDINVELLIDGSFTARQRISLLAGQESPIHFNIKLASPGSHHLCVQLPEDALEFDNRMFAAVEAVEQITVVELRDAGRNGKFDSTWGALETLERSRQLAAKSDGASTKGHGQVAWTLHEGACDAQSLAHADVVLIDGAKTLSPDLVSTLAQFVGNGGGLLLVADPGVDPATWNKLLGGAGLLPAKLASLHTESLGGDRFRSLSHSQTASSPLNLFDDASAGDITNARFYSFFETDQPRAGSEVVLRFDDQSPWAIRSQATDAGRSLLLTTGLAGQGNNLLVREFFLPLMTQLALDAGAGKTSPRTIKRGSTPRLRIPDSKQIVAASFGRQGQPPSPLALMKRGVFTTAEVTDASLESGLYSMLTVSNSGAETAGAPTWFAIQGPRVDSDLTPLSTTQLAAITARLHLTVASDWPQLEQALQTRRAGQEWQSWTALAALLALVAEMFFQHRFSPQAPQKRHANLSGASRQEGYRA